MSITRQNVKQSSSVYTQGGVLADRSHVGHFYEIGKVYEFRIATKKARMLVSMQLSMGVTHWFVAPRGFKPS